VILHVFCITQEILLLDLLRCNAPLWISCPQLFHVIKSTIGVMGGGKQLAPHPVLIGPLSMTQRRRGVDPGLTYLDSRPYPALPPVLFICIEEFVGEIWLSSQEKQHLF
jgi:hypothetical protein